MNGNISNIYCECSAVAKLYTYFSYIHTNEFVFHAGKLIVFFRFATNRRNINSAIVFQFQLWQNIIGINCQDKEHRVTLCHSARLIAVDNRNKRWMKNIALSITLVSQSNGVDSHCIRSSHYEKLKYFFLLLKIDWLQVPGQQLHPPTTLKWQKQRTEWKRRENEAMPHLTCEFN